MGNTAEITPEFCNFNRKRSSIFGCTGGVLYFQIQNWAELSEPPSNRALATRVGELMRLRQKYLHILRPPAGMPINHTSVAMLPYAAEQTDLPPYIIHSKVAPNRESCNTQLWCSTTKSVNWPWSAFMRVQSANGGCLIIHGC
jgi:hypothetical protein